MREGRLLFVDGGGGRRPFFYTGFSRSSRKTSSLSRRKRINRPENRGTGTTLEHRAHPKNGASPQIAQNSPSYDSDYSHPAIT